MDTPRSSAPAPLFRAWFALVLLTLLGLGLARSTIPAASLHIPVAAIVWLKAWIVARCFIRSHLAHPFIARVVGGFIVCVPIALVLTAWFSDRLAGLRAF